jgi:hypothetical protein
MAPILTAFGHFGRHGGPLLLLTLVIAVTALTIAVLNSDRGEKKD